MCHATYCIAHSSVVLRYNALHLQNSYCYSVHPYCRFGDFPEGKIFLNDRMVFGEIRAFAFFKVARLMHKVRSHLGLDKFEVGTGNVICIYAFNNS
jgi:hypothetical protein